MAQQQYRGNLLSAGFPFLSENFGRSVIVGQYDQDTAKATDAAGSTDKTGKSGIPQVYYCHNVVPTQSGIQSVGFHQLIAPLAAESLFVGVLALRDSLDRKAYLGYTSDGRFYISKTPYSAWTLVLTSAATAGKLVTRAYVQGVTYVYVANVGCYKYDFATDTLVAVTLTGLTATAVLGVTSLSGYLFVWTADTIAWSAIANPTDFVPSLSTGAGSGSVEGAAGALLVCASANVGILGYTTGNVISANYTGNSQYPFIFRALPSTGGLKATRHADYDSLSGQQYAYTTSGLQICDVQRATTVLPEVTDFISGREFEDCDSLTAVLTKETLSSAMVKAIKMVSNRYLIVSYGKTALTHALMFDTLLKRWGKFKIAHVSVVDLILGEETADVAKNSIGFLKADGSIQVVDWDSHMEATDAIALLGKYQFMRGRLLQIDSVEFENIEVGDAFTVKNIASLDGKTSPAAVAIPVTTSAGLYRKYNMRAAGVNHTLALSGTFRLNTLVLNFNVHGRR